MEGDPETMRSVVSDLKAQAEEMLRTNVKVVETQANMKSKNSPNVAEKATTQDILLLREEIKSLKVQFNDKLTNYRQLIFKLKYQNKKYQTQLDEQGNSQYEQRENVAKLKAQLLHANKTHQLDSSKKQEKISVLLSNIRSKQVENMKIKLEMENIRQQKSNLTTSSSTQTILTGPDVKTQTCIDEISISYKAKTEEQYEKQNKDYKNAQDHICYQWQEMEKMRKEIERLDTKQKQFQNTIAAYEQQIYKKNQDYKWITRDWQNVNLHSQQQILKLYDLRDENRYLKNCLDHYWSKQNSIRNDESWNSYSNQLHQQCCSIDVKNPGDNTNSQRSYQAYDQVDKCSLTNSVEKNNVRKAEVVKESTPFLLNGVPKQKHTLDLNSGMLKQESAAGQIIGCQKQDSVALFQTIVDIPN